MSLLHSCLNQHGRIDWKQTPNLDSFFAIEQALIVQLHWCPRMPTLKIPAINDTIDTNDTNATNATNWLSSIGPKEINYTFHHQDEEASSSSWPGVQALLDKLKILFLISNMTSMFFQLSWKLTHDKSNQVANCIAQPVIWLKLVPPAQQHVDPWHWQTHNSKQQSWTSETNSQNSNHCWSWRNSEPVVQAVNQISQHADQTHELDLVAPGDLGIEDHGAHTLVDVVVGQDLSPRAESLAGMAWHHMKCMTWCKCHKLHYTMKSLLFQQLHCSHGTTPPPIHHHLQDHCQASSARR